MSASVLKTAAGWTLGSVTAGAVAATTDWKVLIATGAGSFLAFLAHRTLGKRDLQRIAQTAARETFQQEWSVELGTMARVVREGIGQHEDSCGFGSTLRELREAEAEQGRQLDDHEQRINSLERKTSGTPTPLPIKRVD